MPLAQRPLGHTGLSVSALGLGAGHIGGDEDEREVEALLCGALDLGVTLIDTARGYGRAEERIGRYLSHRRGAFVLSTKGGYGVEGVEDWTAAAISLGIERALRVLRTEIIDLFHLHSCPLNVLRRDDIQSALESARDQGKVRVCAYSGENDELAWVVDCGGFGAVQTSVNVFDQRGLAGAVARAAAAGVGVIAKRPLGNAPWRFAERPIGHYAEVYFSRMQAMALQPAEGWLETSLRFAGYAPGVSAILLGTRSLYHLREAVKVLEKGPMSEDEQQALREAFQQHDENWVGQI